MTRGVRLGVDVGSVRVGVAVSDADAVLAMPLATLPRREAPQRVAELVVEHDAVEVVIGLPVTLAGNEGAAVAAVRAFAAELSGVLGATVPIRFVDERLTTVSAERALSARGVRGRQRRAVVDQVAAVAILQAELDRLRGTMGS